MAVNIDLRSTDGTVDRLTKQTDVGRKLNIVVNRQELIDLLLDWNVMHSALSGSTSFKMTEPERRERPRLKSWRLKS